MTARRLLGDGAHEHRVRVPHRAHRDAGAEIEPAAPVGVEELAALAAHEGERRRACSSGRGAGGPRATSVGVRWASSSAQLARPWPTRPTGCPGLLRASRARSIAGARSPRTPPPSRPLATYRGGHAEPARARGARWRRRTSCGTRRSTPRRCRCRRRRRSGRRAAPGSSPSSRDRKRSAPLALSSASNVACRCTLERVRPRARRRRSRASTAAHAILGQLHALADVPRHVAPPRVHVVGQPRLRARRSRTRSTSCASRTRRAAARLVARVAARDAGPVPHHVHRAVLRHAARDGPLPREHLAPAARPPRHRHERSPASRRSQSAS